MDKETEHCLLAVFALSILLLLLVALGTAINSFCESGFVSVHIRIWLLGFGGLILFLALKVKIDEEEANKEGRSE